jgi:antitoxin component YwqK of YwqJK toxin-antitoxin module
MGFPIDGTGTFIKFYSEGGQQQIQARLLNYKYVGEYKEWYPNGQLKAQMFSSEDGLTQGNQLQWWKNGNIKRDIMFKDGKYHGDYIVYFRNGKLKEKTNYNFGKKDGIQTKWYKNGNIRCEIIFQNDIVSCISEWYPQLYNGTPQLYNITKYINDNYDGEYKEWYPMIQGGNLKLCFSLVGDQKNGICNEYYSLKQGGKLKLESEYNIDEIKWIKKWNKKGKLVNETNY